MPIEHMGSIVGTWSVSLAYPEISISGSSDLISAISRMTIRTRKKKKKNEFDLSAKNMSLSAQLRGAFLESGLQVEDQNQATSFSAEK